MPRLWSQLNNEGSSRLAHRFRALWALLGYLLATLVFTFPLVRQFTIAIPGDGFDGWQNYWNLWWVKVALLEKQTSPFFTDLLYHPTGVGLLFHTLNPFNGVTVLPIQIAWGLLPAYNAVVIFSFVMGGLGAWLLVRRLLGAGGSSLAAFAAGAIFTFSPFHIAHLLGHMQVISLEWIPFYILYLLRSLERPTRRNILLAVLFLALVTFCDWYYTLYCLIFTAAALLWSAWRSSRQGLKMAGRPFLAAVGAVAAIWALWAIILSPLLAPMIRDAGQFRFMVPDPIHSRILSADLLAFVTPQEFHPLWGEWAQARARVFTSTVSEHQVFAGFTVLALTLLGGIVQVGSLRRARIHDTHHVPDTSEVPGTWAIARLQPPLRAGASRGLWLLALVVFFVLSLGPVLHVGGKTDLLPGGREIVLPYGWLADKIPFMEITRSVSRFDAMIMLAMGLLAAAGVQWLAQRPVIGRLAPAVAVGLILFEFLPAPYPMSRPDVPQWYHALADDKRTGAVLNLPMAWDRPGYLLQQTVHRKPLAVAYISRDDPRTLVERAPVFQHLRRLGPDIIAFDLAAQGGQALHDLGIRWVILDRYQMPAGPERAYVDAAARQIFGAQPPVYEDVRLTVYEVESPAVSAPYLALGDGWGRFDPGSQGRTFSGHATLFVQAPVSGEATLRVTLAPGSPELDAPRAGGAHVMHLSLRQGANEVTLRLRQPGGRALVTGLALATAP